MAWYKNLISVFPGVSRSGNPHGVGMKFPGGNPVVPKLIQACGNLDAGVFKNSFGLGSLDSDERPLFAGVRDRNLKPSRSSLQGPKGWLAVGGIGNNEKFCLAQAIHDQVINNPAGFGQQKRVLCLMVFQC